MNSAQMQIPGSMTVTARLGRDAYGIHQPELEVTLPRGTHYRRVKAALHHLAAKLELATPPAERWGVHIEVCGDVHGRIHLELGKGNKEEAERGLALLRRLADAAS